MGNRRPDRRRALLKRYVFFMTPFEHAAASESDGRRLAACLRGRESPNMVATRADRAGQESRVREVFRPKRGAECRRYEGLEWGESGRWLTEGADVEPQQVTRVQPR